MSENNNPSDLYDEEFLKKKEEFYSIMEDMDLPSSEIEEDDGELPF